MRKSVLFFVCVWITSAAFSQESYTIKMNLRMEGLPKEYAAYSEQEITTHIKGNMSRTEVSSMVYTSLVYYRNDTLVTLTDMMGNKSGFAASRAELAADVPENRSAKPQVVYTKEKKKIAGYECTKAIVTQYKAGKDQKDTVRTIVWVTDKIKTDQTPRHAQQRRGGVDLGDLKGHPLEMEMAHRQDGMNVKVLMTTQSVDTTPLADSLFVPDPKGYEVMSYKEFKEKKGKR